MSKNPDIYEKIPFNGDEVYECFMAHYVQGKSVPHWLPEAVVEVGYIIVWQEWLQLPLEERKTLSEDCLRFTRHCLVKTGPYIRERLQKP